MNSNKHPITWCHDYEGGRVFYTALGHTNESYADIRFQEMIKGEFFGLQE